MPRILAIDFGLKLSGIAHTIDNSTIALPLAEVHTRLLDNYIDDYISKHSPNAIAIGWPLDLKGKPLPICTHITGLINRLSKKYPNIKVTPIDERFTTSLSIDAAITMGASAKNRREKTMLNARSATLILQTYIELNCN